MPPDRSARHSISGIPNRASIWRRSPGSRIGFGGQWLPGYFDHGADNRSGPRWRYYRTQTAGHNTLVIDGRNQLPDARAPIIGDCVDGDCKWAVFDLSAAYGEPAGSIRRGAALIGRQVVIQDDVRPELSGTIVWAVHTSAEPISVVGSVARFRSGDDRFVLRILEPAAACFV